MNFNFLDRYSSLICICSFAILTLGLFHFKNTVAQRMILAIQISQYQPGDQVEYMRATVSGRTETGMLILEDIVGAKIVTDLKDSSLHIGNFVLLKGRIDESRIFKVDTIDAYPSITMKIALSLLAVIVLFWKLLDRAKVSVQGLILPPPN